MTRKSPRPKALWTKLRGGLKPRTLKKRTPKKVKKVTHIKSRSKVMRGKMAIYRRLRVEFLRENPFCMACGILASTISQTRISELGLAPFEVGNALCFCAEARRRGSHGAAEIHHRKGRGKYLLDKSTWTGICRLGHTFVEQNPVIGALAGLVEKRY